VYEIRNLSIVVNSINTCCFISAVFSTPQPPGKTKLASPPSLKTKPKNYWHKIYETNGNAIPDIATRQHSGAYVVKAAGAD